MRASARFNSSRSAEKDFFRISALDEALRLDPERDRAYKYLGGAHYALGQDEQAIAAFETYLRLQPDDPHRESIEEMIAELK